MSKKKKRLNNALNNALLLTYAITMFKTDNERKEDSALITIRGHRKFTVDCSV